MMRKLYGDAKKAPPPLERLTGEEMVSALWKGEGSLVSDMLESMEPHMDPDLFSELKSNICTHDPSGSDDPSRSLRYCLLWYWSSLFIKQIIACYFLFLGYPFSQVKNVCAPV